MTATVQVWDLPVRLFHWSLVALLGFSWWSGDHHLMDWHRRSGYAILALLVFRIYWGFAGPRTARFADFLRGPAAVLAYARTLARPADKAAEGARLGHNPMGGWSVVLLLFALLAMIGAGLFAVDVDGLESGPLADWISFDAGRRASHLHGLVFNLLLGLVGLHVAAIAFYLFGLKSNLIHPMITGRTRHRGQGGENLPVPTWRVLPGVALAIAVAWAASKGFRFTPGL